MQTADRDCGIAQFRIPQREIRLQHKVAVGKPGEA
jgi:hypothetical protein